MADVEYRVADVRDRPHVSRETNGWVAVVGSLLIAAGAVAVSIAVWTEMPVWLARGAPDAPPRPALARRAVAVPEPLRVPVPPPEPLQTDADVRDGDGAGVSAAPAIPPPAPPPVERVAPASSTVVPPSGVGEALDAYRRAFDTLDAASVAAIWPGADVDTLARSFSELRYQHLSFDRCQTRVTAADYAVASCDGSISAVSNSGDPALRRRHASWTIALRRVAGRWTIETLSTR
jgi:hypothetical protein